MNGQGQGRQVEVRRGRFLHWVRQDVHGAVYVTWAGIRYGRGAASVVCGCYGSTTDAAVAAATWDRAAREYGVTR